MKKLLVFLFLFLIIQEKQFASNALQKGDQLQILYKRVWAYINPEDLGTRTGPYNYSQKVIFQEESDQYKGFIKVILPDQKAAFIRSNLVADDKNFSQEQLNADLKSGKRLSSQYTFLKRDTKFEVNTWVVIAVLIIFAIGLYFLWKRFYKVDQWFVAKSSKRKWPLRKPWFITYSVVAGVVIGGFSSLLAPSESEWFLHEGFRLWGHFPSFIDWILWAAILFFTVSIVMAIIISFFRFSTNIAIWYAIFVFILMMVYFFAGVISGGLVALLLIIYLWASGASSSSSGGNNEAQTTRMNRQKYGYDPRNPTEWNRFPAK